MEKYLDFKESINLNELEEVANGIRNGKIAIFPTETVYGIGVDGLNSEAVEKLYEVKQRPLSKPINLLVSSFEMIENVAQDITETEYKIMKSFFPGPLTIILNKRSCVPNIVTANR
jgi:L-threonylcarbamoyladenylate synthase